MKMRSKGMVWALGAVALLVVLALAAPFLVPLERFIPELARLAGEKLGQPVAIASLRLHLLPTPRAVASGIVVGKREEATVGELEIVPDLFSLLSGPRTLRLVRAEDVRLKEAALAMPGKMPKGQGGGEEVRVNRVELRKVKLEHSAIKLPELDLRAELGERFAVRQARLETRDNTLRVLVEPQEENVSKVKLEASNWTLPAGAPVRFDWLSAEGTLKGQSTLDLPKLEGKLYGGTLKGSVKADWTKQYTLSGKAALAGVDVVPLQKALGQKPQLSGRLNNDTTFSARARTPELLARALAADGPFEVLGGAYEGYDLSKISLTKLERGGSTKFDELKGKVQVRGKEIKVSELCARSKVLTAGGNVAIAPDDKLSGKLDVSVSKTGGFVGIPVQLGGTTADPSFMPSKGYLIGAGVGTVLLPGIGTSIGASVGSRVEGQSDCK